MLFAEVVAASAAVGATRSRTAKAAALADLLRAAAPAEVEPATAWLAGETRQGRIGTGWRTLSGIDAAPRSARRSPSRRSTPCSTSWPPPRARARRSGGPSSARPVRRRHPRRAALPHRLLGGELRQGALEGVMLEAVAAAAEVPAAAVRRAFMLSGRLPETAGLALDGGAPRSRPSRCRWGGRSGRCSPPPASARRRAGGARPGRHRRVQAGRRPHPGPPRRRRGPRLDPHPARDHREVPELVALVRALPCGAVVLDGETLALDDDGRPRAFQDTMSRFGSDGSDGGAAQPVLLRPPAPRRRRPARRAARGPARRAGRAAGRPSRAAHAGRPPPDAGAGRRRAGRRAVGRARGRRRQGAGRAVRGGATRQGVAEGQAGAHARPRRAGRGVGLRAAHRVAVQHPPRRPRPRRRRADHGGQDVQGHDRRAAGLADHHVPRPGPRRRRARRAAAAGAGRRDRAGRRPAQHPLPGGVALRFARVLRYRPDKTPAEADTIDAVRALLRE